MCILTTFNDNRSEIIDSLDLIKIDTDNELNIFLSNVDTYFISNTIDRATFVPLDDLSEFHSSYSQFTVDDILEYYNKLKEEHGNLSIELDSSYGEDYYDFDYNCSTDNIDETLIEYLFKNFCFCFISSYLRKNQKNNLHIINMTENISIDKLKRILKDD